VCADRIDYRSLLPDQNAAGNEYWVHLGHAIALYLLAALTFRAPLSGERASPKFVAFDVIVSCDAA